MQLLHLLVVEVVGLVPWEAVPLFLVHLLQAVEEVQ
jgi:hypothetical protein